MRKRIADWLYSLAVWVDPEKPRRMVVAGDTFDQVRMMDGGRFEALFDENWKKLGKGR